MLTMPIKFLFMAATMALFLFVIFLDQNIHPVPLKIVIGSPYQISLSGIIITSLLIGMAAALVGILMLKKVRKRD